VTRNSFLFPNSKMTSIDRGINQFRAYGNSGCNYARLGAYTAGFRGIRPPVPMTTVAGYYVVPSYSSPGYDTLTHGGPRYGCGDGGPYFQMGQAYGYGAQNCSTQYMGSICM
jgi:hypothetical protein